MKNLILLLSVLFIASTLSAQIKIDNDSYKFRIEFGKGWKSSGKTETDKKDVINYSLTKNDKFTASVIAFKLNVPGKLDDFVYTLEKDFNLNIPEKTSGFNPITGDVYEGKFADYKDNENIEKIYYYVTTKDSSGEYYCYMVRFIADVKYKKTDFDSDINSIIGTFKVIL